MSGKSPAASRREGQLGIHSIDYFCIAAPDLDRAATFYESFGLRPVTQGQSLALHTHGMAHRWGQLVESAKKRLQHLSFGVFEEDLPRFRERLQQRKIALVRPPKGVDDSGLWFHGHDGLLTEIRVAPKSSPDGKAAFALDGASDPLRGTYSRRQAPRVHPQRLSHVAIFTADVDAAIQFYADVLGMRLSDRSADIVAFMHGIHGSDHHMLAFVKSGGPGIHHSSWEMSSVQDIGLGAAHMAGAGFDRGWGLGRHVLGSNFFHYVRDPWGSYCEYSGGIDYVPASLDWAASNQPVEDAMFLWGPMPPEDFAQNFELA